MKKKRLLSMFTAMALAVMVLTGCGSAGSDAGEGENTADPAGEDTVVVVMNTGSEPEAGFDPAYGWGAGEHVHEPLIQSTLTVTTLNLEIAYDLAEELSVSEDGLNWTVEIRDDVYFTNGEKLTAEDVAFTYNIVKELSTVNDFTMLDLAEAQGETTVVFRLNRPYAVWPYSMANVGIVPQHSYGPDYGQNPVGSGRYILKQWDKGQQVILEANPDYYGDAPKIERVVILFMTEDAAYAAVQAGQADLAYTTATYAQNPVSGYGLLSAETVDNRGFNLPAIPYDGEKGNDVTSDLAIRQAINIGIDRELLISQVLYGHGTPAYSVSDKLPWFSEVNVVDYDFAQAVQILEEAGWIPAEDGIRVKDGQRAEVNIMYPAGDTVRQSMAAQATDQISLLGIDATFEGVGWDVAYDRAQTEIMTWGWGAHTPMEMYNIYHTAPGQEYAEYSPYVNAQVDQYMDEALAAGSLEESYGLWRLAQEEIARDVPWVWLANVDHLYWYKDGLMVAEQKLHPHGHGWSVVNNVDQWEWK